jgi:hypothetical protein
MRRTNTTIAVALISLSAAAHADSSPEDLAAAAERAPSTQEVGFEPVAAQAVTEADAAVTRRDGAMVFESIGLSGKIQYPAIDMLLASPRLDLQVTPREEQTFACKIPTTLRSSSL